MRTATCPASAFHRWLPGYLNGRLVLCCRRCGHVVDYMEAREAFERLQAEAKEVERDAVHAHA
jgi:hypothetical protein